MHLPEEPFVNLQTTNAAGLPLSEEEIGLMELYQSDIPLLGQETPIHGLLPGQLGVVLDMNKVEYIFYANSEAAQEHENILAAEAIEEDIIAQANQIQETQAIVEGVPDMSPVTDLDDTLILSQSSYSQVWDLDETLIFGEDAFSHSSNWEICSTDSVMSMEVEFAEVPDRESFDFYFYLC